MDAAPPPHRFRHYLSAADIWLCIGLDGVCVQEIDFGADPALPELPADHPLSLWLDAYAQGVHWPLPPVAPARTPFQQRLRAALLAIPFGDMRTYGQLAAELGSAPRALGQALGANPMPILFPCHRVVAANGIGGFSGGVEWKLRLLAFERDLAAAR